MTVPVSAVLLFWYRRAVSRAMHEVSEAADDDEGQNAAGATPSAAEATAAKARPCGAPLELTARESSARRRLAVIYAAGGAVAASALTALFFSSPAMERVGLRVFVVWYVFCWPVVPTVATLLAVSRRRALGMFAVYLAGGIAVTWTWSLFNKVALGHSAVEPAGNAVALLTFLAYEAWLPYVIIVVTANRRLRSVSPLTLAALLVFSFTALALRYAIVAAMDAASAQRWLLALGGAHVMSVLFLLACLPVGLGCWWGLNAVAREYARRSFSDVQLVVDTWWLIVVFDVVVMAAFDHGWFALIGLLAWAAQRITVQAMLRAWRPPADAERAPRLLILRVFGFQRRSERLFDDVGQRWRLRGSVALIAGTDLASRIIDPGDVVSFVGGRFGRQFVHTSDDLDRQLLRLDQPRDPDGRFRVVKFFCHTDTWQPTVEELMKRADVVLMDLRGFSQMNQGCRFELQALSHNALLAKTVFVVDDATDSRLLDASVRDMVVAPAGVSHGVPLNVVHVARHAHRDIQAIHHALRVCA